MNRQEDKSKAEQGRAPGAAVWSREKKLLASAVIAFHVLAVVIAPWSQPPPASELSGRVARLFEPYQHAVYIYHGYRFFAPNPGPSHVIDYELEFADGTRQRGRFPNTEDYWPRLHYHRFLMLAEAVDQFAKIPPQPQWPPDTLGPKQQQRANREYQTASEQRELAQAKYDLLIEAVSQSLLREHDAQKVQLWAVQHVLATPEMVRDGVSLDAPESYGRHDLGVFERAGQ